MGKTENSFEPLDDLYSLLNRLEQYYGFDIETKDYIVGRKQLYYTFIHETLHAFIGKAAKWIYDLTEDETDFIDEVAVRIIIDDILKRFDIYKKVDLFYHDNVNHRKELSLYGYNLTPEQYDDIEKEYNKRFSDKKDIDHFCKYIHEKYKEYGIKRREDFSYDKNKQEKK
jgi:hypothetical protein